MSWSVRPDPTGNQQTPLSYREQARAIREIAALAKRAEIKRRLLQIAAIYDGLARRAEAMSSSAPAHLFSAVRPND